MKTLLPGYVWPYDSAEWDAILEAAPDVLIVNPASGPGAEWSPAWEELIVRAQARGIRTIGYVPTHYGARSAFAVLGDVRLWRRWYPQIAGIFFDEAPTAPLGYLRRLHGEARGGARTGLSFFNPGGMSLGTRAAMLALPGSVWVTFEGSAEEYEKQQPKALWLRSRQCHLVYAAPPELEGRMSLLFGWSGVGWSFQTADVLPNPWDRPLGRSLSPD